MQIKEIELTNFRGIKKQKIELLSNINVFVGVNGSGKSTILDAIAISLSWLVKGIDKIESQGDNIPDDSIKNATDYASIKLKVAQTDNTYQWENIEFKRGYPADKQSNLLQLNQLVFECQKTYKNRNTLPMIAYYPINRIAKGISPNIKTRDTISQLDVYDNALGNKANFQAFFKWFREQDDILNEYTTSRQKWMKKKKQWIYLKVNQVLKHLSDYKSSNDQLLKRFKEDSFLLENPRYLFFELIDYLHLSIKDDNIDYIENLLHNMSRLIDRDDEYNIHLDNRDFDRIEMIIEKIISTKIENNEHLNFIWDIFLLFIELKFWKLSHKARNNIEQHFKYAKPTENTNINNFIEVIKNIVINDTKRLEQALVNHGKELEVVTQTIEHFIPKYQNLRITRIPTPRMLVDKNGETLNLNQLSDGEKNMIAMIGDIARRLTMANPKLENPLEGDGVVMIDEVDLHLHPAWQRVIISKLTAVFPNCQFIVSTHSPQILSHVNAENIFVLKQSKDSVEISKPTESYGKSSDRQLEDILGVEARPLKIKEDLDRLFKLIQEMELKEAKELMSKLEDKIEGREVELVKANVLIKRKEILGK